MLSIIFSSKYVFSLRSGVFEPTIQYVMDRMTKNNESDSAFAMAVAELEKMIMDPKFMRLRSSSAEDITQEDEQYLKRANALAEEVSNLRRQRVKVKQKL